MSLAPGRRLGPYEIVAPLGAGGMGEVWRARDTRLGREVAIKVLPEAFARDPERLARFQREARAVAALSNPHIVALHDIGEEDGTVYAVTELLQGETLRGVLRRGPLPLRKAVEQAVQIARGLAAAHDKGIVHRDLKPENVFVTADGQVKILDFGLARQESHAGPFQSEVQTLTRDTAAGVLLGTVGYMSPEQVQGLPVDHRSDVFAFGCVLYETLTGRRAFDRPTAAETLTAILREDPPEASLAGRPLPLALERTMRRCLEKSPAERFQSARDVAFALEATSGDSQSSAGVAVAGRRAWRRPVLLAALAATLTAVAGLGWLAGRRTAGTDPRLTYDRLTFRQGPIITARFGPDAKSVYYGAAWEGSPFRIYQTSHQGGEVALPLEDADLLSVSREGQLAVLFPRRHGVNAWLKAGTLAVVSTVGAAARVVSEDVLDADWAPDGRSLLVLRQVGAAYNLEFPIGRKIYATTRFTSTPRISPTGDRVAFYEGDQQAMSVCLVDLSGRRVVLSAGWADSWKLAWSPDGREVWFAASKPCSASGATLFAVDLAGRRRLLLDGPGTIDIKDVAPNGDVLLAQHFWRSITRAWGPTEGPERDLSWLELSYPAGISADGRIAILNTVSTCSAEAETGLATFLRPTDARAPIRVADGWLSSPSPDGRFLAATEPHALRLIPTGAGEVRQVPLDFQPSSWLSLVQWMPTGNSLLVAEDEEQGRIRLKQVSVADGHVEATSAAFLPGGLASYSSSLPISPDGRLAAVRGMDGRVLLVPLDGRPTRPLPPSEVNDLPADWAPDSRSLFVFRPGEVPARVFQLSIDGRRTLWKVIHPTDVGATGIGSLYLAQNGRVGVYGYQVNVTDLYLVRGLR